MILAYTLQGRSGTGHINLEVQTGYKRTARSVAYQFR